MTSSNGGDLRDRVRSLPDPFDQLRAEALRECIETFRSWLHLPDPGALYVTLAAVVANRAEGDPVWPLLVGAPGSGKTEVLTAILAERDVYLAADLTKGALLSGTSKREQAKDAKGGKLREIGAFGILVLKDFGTVLSMNRDTRAEVLAALREIYDGRWTRDVGTDGGQTLSWEGKIGLIAGCTPVIDSHHAVMGSMGERFVLYRLRSNDDDERKQARMALDRRSEVAMRKALSDSIAPVFGGVDVSILTDARVTDETKTWLVHLAQFAAHGRSSVERDAHSRDIDLIPDPEMPARLALVLRRMLSALVAIGVDEPTARELVRKMAMDSMPAIRARLLRALPPDGAEWTTIELATQIEHPTTTTRRALEDLSAHGLVSRRSREETGSRSDSWCLSDWSRDRLGIIDGTVPEMSVGMNGRAPDEPETGPDPVPLYTPVPTPPDISGTVVEEVWKTPEQLLAEMNAVRGRES